MIAAKDPNANITSYGYDAVGNQITVTDANNNTTSYAYSSFAATKEFVERERWLAA